MPTPPDLIADFWASATPTDLWAFDAAQMQTALGLDTDPWQVRLLRTKPHRALLNCCRQSGKTTTTALLALHEAMFCPADAKSKDILLFAPTGRQSDELLHRITGFYNRLGKPVKRQSDRVSVLDFANGARILALPNNEEAIRGYSPCLVVIDEASRVPDALYRAIRPMLAVTGGRLICLSTPFGKQGFFYEEWIGTGAWDRVQVTADECPRIRKEFLADEERVLGPVWFRQEYYCSFEVMAGLVYPDFGLAVSDVRDVKGRKLAGCDFGFHNPAAVLFGILDPDDVLHIVDEIYGSRRTDDDLILEIKGRDPRYEVEGYYCDSEAPGSIEKFRRADLPARKAMKKIDLGIRAVTARIRTGRLKVFRTCKQTIREGGLYRYHTEEEQRVPSDNPLKANDHAMDALRYLVCGIDRVREVRGPNEPPVEDLKPEPELAQQATSPDAPQERYGKPVPLGQADDRERERARQREHLEQYGWENF